MRYPTLDTQSSEQAAQSRLDGYTYPFDRFVQYKGDGPDFDDGPLADIIEQAEELRLHYGPELNHRDGARFESALVEPVHRGISITEAAAADPGFWRWLSVRHLFHVINYRHPPKGDQPSWSNFGLRAVVEGFAWRLWYRGELAYDDANADDPYHLARLGDQDFWRSHLLRIRYGGYRPLARALIRFQYPDHSTDKPCLKTGIASDGIRMLAKRIRRRQTVIAYEALNSDELMSLIEELSHGLTRAR